MSEPLTLRPYQVDCIARLREAYARGARAPLFALPTAGGKTVIMAAITAGARAKGRRTLLAAHRRELVKQASKKLIWAGVLHGVIAADFEPSPDELVQVASIQTIARRLDRIAGFGLILLDEAHHVRAGQWTNLITSQPTAKLLGVTATPARADGKGLGIEHGGCFDTLVLGPSTADLIEQGYLSRARCFVPAQRNSLAGVRTRAGDYVSEDLTAVMHTAAITGDAIGQYRRRADHAPAIAFCAGVAHAEHVAKAFVAAGYRAACVHGEMPTAERDALIEGLGNGAIEVLSSCDLISEGLDVPAVGAVILLRPTKSLVLHRQQIGRGMRLADGKSALIVNDHVGNVLRHGLPEVEPRWSLAGVDKEQREAPTWECPSCGMLNSIGRRVCEECSFERPIPQALRPLPRSAAGELAELTRERLVRIRSMSYRDIVGGTFSEAELRAYAKARGYHTGWVRHRLREQRDAVA